MRLGYFSAGIMAEDRQPLTETSRRYPHHHHGNLKANFLPKQRVEHYILNPNFQITPFQSQPTMNTASRASELDKLYQTIYQDTKNATGSTWENTVMDNARTVSTPLAIRMLVQMGLGEDTTTPFKLLENACGAGVVAPLLQQIIKPDVLKQSSILCGDFSDQAVELAKKRIETGGWVNTKAATVDAQVRPSSGSIGLDFLSYSQMGQKTGLADGSFTHVATNIGFHVVPDSEAALSGKPASSSRSESIT